jgi:glycosyltransferase involved in cell wall biosynthesis
MDILLITRRFPPAPGGVETQVKEIANRLLRKGHRVTVYSSDLYRDNPIQRLPRLPRDFDGIETRRFRAIPVPGRAADGTSVTPAMLFACLALGDLPRIVHSHGLNLVTISASLLAKRRRKLKVIHTTHLDPSMLSGKPLSRTLSKFDGLVALTEIERTRMLRLGLDESKIRLIPDGVDTMAFMDLPGRDYFRRLGVQGRLILYAGRIDNVSKGCDVLIEAVSLVQDRIGKCTVVFAGPDWGSQEYLGALAGRKKVPVIFTGNLGRQDLKAALVSCDLFVLPSRVEAVGLSILEAMLCGAPVVATRVGGIPSVVRNEETGLLVSPGDPHGLADAICRILEDGRLSSRISDNGKRFAAAYSIDETVRQLEEFYQYLLER